MKKFIFAVSLLLVLIGCADQVDITAESPYIGGTKGIIASFEPLSVIGDSGIAEVFEDEGFPIDIRVQNKGEYEVPAGGVTITLKGIRLADFNLLSEAISSTEDLEGISDINVDGGEETFDFGEAEYQPVVSGAVYDADIFADIVFKYQTTASVPKVCYVHDVRDTSICSVTGDKEAFSSAAPIQVVSVTQNRAGSDEIKLDFRVENVGTGRTKSTKFDADFDSRFNIIEFSISDADFDCAASGGEANEARLDAAGSATIRCTRTLSEGDAFTKQVDLTLDYYYKNLIQDSIRIKKA